MRWWDFWRNSKRNIVAIYEETDKAYLAALMLDKNQQISIEWLDILEGKPQELPDRVLGRLLLHDQGNCELIIFVGRDNRDLVRQEYPVLEPTELANAIEMDIKYFYGGDWVWCYETQADTIRVTALRQDKLVELMGDYSEVGMVAAVMPLSDAAENQDIALDWGEWSPDNLDGKILRLVDGAYSYAKNIPQSCLIRLPQWLYKWQWLRVVVVLLTINILVTLMLVIGGLLLHKSINRQTAEYTQQAALLEDIKSLKSETEVMKQAIKRRTNLLANLRQSAKGISGYGIMVELGRIPPKGVTLTETEVIGEKEFILQGKADSTANLLKYIQQAGNLGGITKDLFTLESSQQDENGNIQFVCKGQL